MTNINIIKDEKNILDVEINNLTIVELLRAYLNKDSNVKLAAWKREHPEKNPILHIETSSGTAKSALKKAISTADKDVDKAVDDFKKMK